VKILLAFCQKVFNILILLCRSAATEQVSVVVMLLDMYLKYAMLEFGQVISCSNWGFICLFIYSSIRGGDKNVTHLLHVFALYDG
jgi:hypothetical protein